MGVAYERGTPVLRSQECTATLEVTQEQISSQSSHRCHPILVAFVWKLTKETINLPLCCLQGGWRLPRSARVPPLLTAPRTPVVNVLGLRFRLWGKAMSAQVTPPSIVAVHDSASSPHELI